MKVLKQVLVLMLLTLIIFTMLPVFWPGQCSCSLVRFYSSGQQESCAGEVFGSTTDFSDSWSAAFVNEGLVAKGKAQVKDSFTMFNLWPEKSANFWFDPDHIFEDETTPLSSFVEPDVSSSAPGNHFKQPLNSQSSRSADFYQDISDIGGYAKPESVVFSLPGFKFTWLDLF